MATTTGPDAPARPAGTFPPSLTPSSGLPALIAVRDVDHTMTPSDQTNSRHADEKEGEIMGKRESFVYHVKNNCGSESTVVYVNTV